MRNYTDLTILVDRSGSMENIKDSMEEALRSYLDGLRKNVTCEVKVTAVEFDDKYQNLFGPVDLKSAPAINITPLGSTALVGALGRVVEETGTRLSNLSEDERPNQVIIVVITDGQENATNWVEWAKDKYTHEKVMNAVSHQRDVYNWTFVYLGANQDAFAVAKSFGIPISNTLAYSSTRGSVRKGMENLTSASVRAMNFSPEQKLSRLATEGVYESAEQDTREDNDKGDDSADDTATGNTTLVGKGPRRRAMARPTNAKS